jgi:histidyl-tRNA synthetase
VRAEMEQAGRSLRGQLRHADRMGARAVAIVGDGIEVKDMASGEQRPVSGIAEAIRAVSG